VGEQAGEVELLAGFALLASRRLLFAGVTVRGVRSPFTFWGIRQTKRARRIKANEALTEQAI
jgi:hypothetical protein